MQRVSSSDLTCHIHHFSKTCPLSTENNLCFGLVMGLESTLPSHHRVAGIYLLASVCENESLIAEDYDKPGYMQTSQGVHVL